MDDSPWNRYRSVPLVYRIAVGFVLGGIFGFIVGKPAAALEPLGTLFLRLLKMLVVPLIVFTLLSGVKQLTPTKLGRIGGSVVGLYLATTAIAGFLGLVVANILNPGTGVQFTGGKAQSASPPSLGEVFLNIVPTNPVAAFGNGDVLSIVFFTLVFGLGLAIARDSTESEHVRDGIKTFFEIVDGIVEGLFTVVWGVMEYGVVGVFALLATSMATHGLGAIESLAMLVAAVALGTLLQISITYLGLITMLGLGQHPIKFLRGAKDAMVTAFSIRSSTGTLPVTMQNAEDDLKIDESLYGFSLPLGATINMDGAAIRQAITAVFAANLFGVHLGLGDQVTLLVTVVLVSIGTAGVPGAGLIMLTVVLQSVSLPLTVVGFVAGVDPILGRIATMNNVTGDLAVATLAAKWNNAIDFSTGVWTDDETAGETGLAISD
ncbi:amino acid transporter [Haladaptatus sp. R4]|nr:amino acid transporter [Haladaptatus sp. R4]